MKTFDPAKLDDGLALRPTRFQNLMRYRITNILMVSSLYDLFVLEEDGRLYEQLRQEYHGLSLSHAPEITRVSSGRGALSLIKKERRYDLVISTQHIDDMDSLDLAELMKKADPRIPVVMLAFDSHAIIDATEQYHRIFDHIFVWKGDFRIIIAIIKCIEDLINVKRDVATIGVQVIVMVENNLRFYSSYLPILYTEIVNQSQRLILEGINLSHKYLRLRARPKILLCNTFEEGWGYIKHYKDNLLGIIADIGFERNGILDPNAGLELIRLSKEIVPELPALLQSYNPEVNILAREVGAVFLRKDSPTLLTELRCFSYEYFGFGDFVFRNDNGDQIGTARDLPSLRTMLENIPANCLRFHAERHQFSRWLKARTEFWLAEKVRACLVSDFPDIEDLRRTLVALLDSYITFQRQGVTTDFAVTSFDAKTGFARVGGGSLGGKARGLSFVNTLINADRMNHDYGDFTITLPATLVLATDIFDEFMEENNLNTIALNSENDSEIRTRFIAAERFPDELIDQLRCFLAMIKEPIAVRSSSLLEDSQYFPFAGVYETYMLPNSHPNPDVRLRDLLDAIKYIYASTYFSAAKLYIKNTAYRLEQEKMAIILQRIVGEKYAEYFYPVISGVAKSYNFYPSPPQSTDDGVVSVAFGLGKIVVDGGNTVKFSPKYPLHLPQFSSTKDVLRYSQQHFYAIDLSPRSGRELFELKDASLVKLPLAKAEAHGNLHYVCSTYSRENDAVYDGVSRSGVRLVTFAPILKHRLFPMTDMLEYLLAMGRWGMGTPVEIEFAINLSDTCDGQHEFNILQVRPLVLKKETSELYLGDYPENDLICHSDKVMGHGVREDIHDIVFVDYYSYDRSKSKTVAEEVGKFNAKLVGESRPYLLIGVGRWGTLDPWLGIPVSWEMVCGAGVIIESCFKDFAVAPSQGSHFFQNLTSAMIGYFTVNIQQNQGFIDWNWLAEQPAYGAREFTRHLRFEQTIVVKMNGKKNEGIITKPQNIEG